MKKISMLDLSHEIEDFGNEIDESIRDVMDSTMFINGKEVKKFEEDFSDYLGVKHVISCGNGTDALQIALMASGLEKGDGVITTPFTFFATAEVISLLGMEVQFADINPDTFNIDPASVEKRIKDNTKAIMPVHLFGQTAEMDEINNIAAEHDLIVIEDSAQATGGQYKSDNIWRHNGSIGDMGCTSFFPSKNLACYGDGGAIFTDDDNLAEKCAMLKSHGSKVKYENDRVGVNSRLDTIQAAVLNVKLKRLNKFNENRRNVASRYRKDLSTIPEIQLPAVKDNVKHVYHQFTIKVLNGRRDELKNHLSENGVSSAIYYKKPLHFQSALSDLAYANGDFPISEKVAKEVLSLPIHPYLSEEDQSHIIESVKSFFN